MRVDATSESSARSPTNIGVFCFVLQASSVLLVRRNYGDRFWSLPGGAVEHSEDLNQGLLREVKEETGVCLRSPEFVCGFYSVTNYSVAFCFWEAVEGRLPPFSPTPEIADRAWFPISELPGEMTNRQRHWIATFREFLDCGSSLGVRDSDV